MLASDASCVQISPADDHFAKVVIDNLGFNIFPCSFKCNVGITQGQGHKRGGAI